MKNQNLTFSKKEIQWLYSPHGNKYFLFGDSLFAPHPPLSPSLRTTYNHRSEMQTITQEVRSLYKIQTVLVRQEWRERLVRLERLDRLERQPSTASSSKELASKVFGPYSRKQTKDSAVMHSLSEATRKMVQRPRRTTACAMMAEPVPSSPKIPSAVFAFTPTQEGSTPIRDASRSLIAAL